MAQCLDSKAFLGTSTAFKSAQTARSNVVSYMTLLSVEADVRPCTHYRNPAITW